MAGPVKIVLIFEYTLYFRSCQGFMFTSILSNSHLQESVFSLPALMLLSLSK